MPSRGGFTLVELMVVVTIIVILLALLTPALDRAVYQAELAVCGGRLKAGASGVLRYALGSARHYPHREGPLDPNSLGWGPNALTDKTHDDRPTLFRALPPELMLDPFCAPIDLTTDADAGLYYANYSLYFSYRYLNPKDSKGMYRMGSRMTYGDDRYRLLIADADRLHTNSDQSTHPDAKGELYKSLGYQDALNVTPGWNLQGLSVTFSNWTTGNRGLRIRGTLDLGYAYDDGAVLRYNGVEIGDDRMGRTPDHSTANPNNLPGSYRQLPRN